MDLTGDSSEDEKTVKRFTVSITKQPGTTGKPQAAYRHRLDSLGRLPDDQRSECVKRIEDLPFLHKRSKGGAPPEVLPSRVTQVPSARDKEGGPEGKWQAARAPKKAAVAELARLKFACPGDKLESTAGKRKRDQLGSAIILSTAFVT